MRHALTARFVIIALVVAVVAGGLFAVFANLGDDPERTEEILALEGDFDTGRDLYVDTPGLACASCHAVPAEGIESDNGGPPLHAVDTDARTTIASLVEGTVGAHDAQEYEQLLSDQEIAHIATWVEQVMEE